MDLRQKCKNCRNGVLERTFKGNEFRCFVCGYTTERMNLTIVELAIIPKRLIFSLGKNDIHAVSVFVAAVNLF
ncbi:MAG: hypothetical protein ACM3JQ_03435 [Candidatus Eiseniibacteriota bacterium]